MVTTRKGRGFNTANALFHNQWRLHQCLLYNYLLDYMYIFTHFVYFTIKKGKILTEGFSLSKYLLSQGQQLQGYLWDQKES